MEISQPSTLVETSPKFYIKVVILNLFQYHITLANSLKRIANNMNINVNHKPKNITEASSLDTLLNELQINKQGIAVAINNQIITKKQWVETQLNENDNVTIIQATQGG